MCALIANHNNYKLNDNYGQQLFDYFCDKRKWICIQNMQRMPSQLKHALFGDKDEIQISNLTNLFPHCTQITFNNLNTKLLTQNAQKYIDYVARYVTLNDTRKSDLNEIIFESHQEVDSKPNSTLNRLANDDKTQALFQLQLVHCLSI
eukprot:32305_1